MADGVRYGSQEFAEQIRFQLGKLNVPTAGWTDVWRDEHDTAFMVAGAYKAQLLTDLRTAVERAIKDGTSIDVFRRDFAKIVAEHGWSYNGGFGWRTRVIYHTNLRQSYNAGRYAQLTDPDMLAVRPWWVYHHRDGQKFPRPMHVSWDRLALPGDDPWWRGHFPSNGWGCDCYVTAESRRSMERKGLAPGTAPPTKMVERTVGQRSGNPHTVTVPEGVDPGFDYAPGATRAARIRDELGRSADKLPPDIGGHLRRGLDDGPTLAPPAPIADRPLPQTLDEWITEGRGIADQLAPELDAARSPQDVVLAALRKVRQTEKPIDVPGRGRAAEVLREVSRWIPDDWTARSDDAGKVTAKSAGRRSQYAPAFRNGGGAFRISPGSGQDVALHELMHRIQHVMPGLDRLFQSLHERRTRGERLEVLYSHLPKETGRPDGYVERYQGREYSIGWESGRALEVLTMAFQAALGGDPLQFRALRQRDPEMLHLVLATLWRYR